MSIENADVIDGAGIARDAREVVLTISDHLTWDDREAHFEMIEKKLGRYLQFVESGQVIETFPGTEGLPVHIRLFHQFPPSEMASKFLLAAATELRERNIRFSFGPLPNEH